MPPATGSDMTRIVLVQPHALVRQGIIRVLESLENFSVVGHTGTAKEAVRLAGELTPDIVVLDADLPNGEGGELVTQLSALGRGSRVLLLSERASSAHVRRLLGSGAAGYMLKDISIDDFADAVQRVAEGEMVLHGNAAAALAGDYSPEGRGTSSLTERQTEVLRLLAEGLGNKQIARRLDIGTHTVKTHVSRILEKLEVSSRTEAVVVAMEDRLIV